MLNFAEIVVFLCLSSCKYPCLQSLGPLASYLHFIVQHYERTTDQGDTFEFASETKALLRKPERRVPRLRTLVRFLGEGLTDDEWDTFYRRMRMLPPAHTLTVSRRGLQLERYWTIDPRKSWKAFCPDNQMNMPPHQERLAEDYFPQDPALKEAADKFRGLFLESVNLRLRSDVPVGTCLSGGLDSSSVVTCASELIDRPVETFSSIYPDRGYDEKRFIEDVVKACGTNAHPVESDGMDLPDIFDKIVWAQDEPTACRMHTALKAGKP